MCHDNICLVHTHCRMFHIKTWQKISCLVQKKLPLYFTCERAIRRILYFTHTLRLYSIQRKLLNSKTIWWYCRCAVCARIWDCAIFCAILHIYDYCESQVKKQESEFNKKWCINTYFAWESTGQITAQFLFGSITELLCFYNATMTAKKHSSRYFKDQ